MTSYTHAAMQYAPWRRDIAWWIVLIQGLVLGGIGLYALFGAGAARTLVLLLGIYVLIHSLWIIFTAWRRPAESRAMLQLVSSGAGLLAGAVVVFQSFFASIPEVAALAVFALGLITTGVLGVLASFGIRRTSGFPWGVMVRGLIDLGLGAYIVYALRMQAANTEGAVSAVSVIGWLGTIGGVLLIAYAIFLYTRTSRGNQGNSSPASTSGAATKPASESSRATPTPETEAPPAVEQSSGSSGDSSPPTQG